MMKLSSCGSRTRVLTVSMPSSASGARTSECPARPPRPRQSMRAAWLRRIPTAAPRAPTRWPDIGHDRWALAASGEPRARRARSADIKSVEAIHVDAPDRARLGGHRLWNRNVIASPTGSAILGSLFSLHSGICARCLGRLPQIVATGTARLQIVATGTARLQIVATGTARLQIVARPGRRGCRLSRDRDGATRRKHTPQGCQHSDTRCAGRQPRGAARARGHGARLHAVHPPWRVRSASHAPASTLPTGHVLTPRSAHIRRQNECARQGCALACGSGRRTAATCARARAARAR